MELATSALTFDKDPTKIVTNPLSSIEDAALANIVTFKSVEAKVNQIKAKFGLNNNENGWREKINEIGKKKKKKIEKETNKTRNKVRKEAQKKHKDVVKKRDEWLIVNTETNDETIETDEGEDDISEELNVKREKKSTKSIVSDNSRVKNLSKKKLPSDPLKVADPFFLTGSGENYLATKTIDRIQPSAPNDGLDRKERRAQQFGSKPKTIPKRKDQPAGPSKIIKSTTISEDLHPSWAAKMKSKGIDKFQGKKMKFDDEEPSSMVSKAVTPKSVDDTEKIHPSWAAKQKAKPVISEFKGSKIRFDE